MKTGTGRIACGTACVIAGTVGLGAGSPQGRLAQPVKDPGPASSGAIPVRPVGDLPERISISGVVRDFHAYGAAGGHPDFERYNSGHRVGLVQTALDQDGKPAFAGQGRSVTTEYRDVDGRNINPAMYDDARKDVAGQLTETSSPAVTNAQTFAQWYRDVPGVNTSKTCPVVLTRQGQTSLYVFQAQDDASTPAIEGFFPADNDLFNEMHPTYLHNYHFTLEMTANFVYRRGTGQVFTFSGDDDVWVFIDGRLVIDVGGVHGPVSQTVDLDRLDGLVDGRSYPLKFFFAERHTTGSNCRIETSLTLVPALLPSTSALYD